MSLPSRDGKERRRLSEKIPNPAPRARKMSEPAKSSVLKRRAEDFDGLSRGPINSATKRRDSKRVSFGGDYVKYFDKDAKISDDNFGPAQLFPEPSPRINSPGPHNSNLPSGMDTFDDVGEDTLHLPVSPPSQPRQASPHPANAHSSAQDQAKYRTSAVFDFIDDESPGVLSDDLDNETIHMRRDSNVSGRFDDTLASNSTSEGDISIQIPGTMDFREGSFHQAAYPDEFQNHPPPMQGLSPLSSVNKENNADVQPVHIPQAPNPAENPVKQSFLEKRMGRLSLPGKSVAEKRVQRKSLPENRKLFSMDEEDDTIHLKDNPVRLDKKPLSILKKHNYPQPQSSNARDVEEDTTVQKPSYHQGETPDRPTQSTPRQSVLRSRIREVTSATKGTPMASHAEYKSPAKSARFSIDSFLNHLKVPRTLPQIMNVTPKEEESRINLDTTAGKIVSWELNRAVFAELRTAHAGLSAEIETLKEETAAAARSYENAPPNLFEQLGNFADKSAEEAFEIQTGAKRLWKAVGMQETCEWKRKRIARELIILEMLTKASQSLYEEEVEVKKNEVTLLAIADDSTQVLEQANMNPQYTEEHCLVPAEDQTRLLNLWQERQATLSSRQAVNVRIKDALATQDARDKQLSEYDAKLAEARRKLSAGASSILMTAVDNKKKEQELLEAVLGIQLWNLFSTNIDVRVASFADIRFCLSGRSVTSVEVHSLFDDGPRLDPHIDAYINEAISKCTESCLGNVAGKRQIPLVLHLTNAYLHKVKKTFLDALSYLDEHGQEGDYFKPAEANEESADLVVCPSYFSSTKRVLFDVTLTQRSFPPTFDGKTLERKPSFFSLNVGPVFPLVGKAPAVQDVKDIIDLRSGDEPHSLRQNMQVIHELL